MSGACSIRVRGVVQGVGFRPFVYRLARANTLAGWSIVNGEEGVEIFLEGAEKGLLAFLQDLKTQSPPASSITEVEVHRVAPLGLNGFTIRESHANERLYGAYLARSSRFAMLRLKELGLIQPIGATAIPISTARIVVPATRLS